MGDAVCSSASSHISFAFWSNRPFLILALLSGTGSYFLSTVFRPHWVLLLLNLSWRPISSPISFEEQASRLNCVQIPAEHPCLCAYNDTHNGSLFVCTKSVGGEVSSGSDLGLWICSPPPPPPNPCPYKHFICCVFCMPWAHLRWSVRNIIYHNYYYAASTYLHTLGLPWLYIYSSWLTGHWK